MQHLKEYCYALIIVSLISTLIILLAPTNSKLIKYLRWITALCVTAVLISPILNLSGDIEFTVFKNGDPSFDYENANDMILKEFSNKLSKSAKELVSEKFNVNCTSVDIEIISDDIEAVVLKKIKVLIDTESSFLKADIKKYLKEKLSCEIEIYD